MRGYKSSKNKDRNEVDKTNLAEFSFQEKWIFKGFCLVCTPAKRQVQSWMRGSLSATVNHALRESCVGYRSAIFERGPKGVVWQKLPPVQRYELPSWWYHFWAILKRCQWCDRMYLCNFVSLYVRMFVARANKVEGTMSWCLRTNEILAST